MKSTRTVVRLLQWLLMLSLAVGFSVPAMAQLHGTYTIGSGGSYSSIAAAVAALKSQGVSAAVTFNILSGSYGEHADIPAITGASGTNTITFQASTGNAADVTVFYNAAAAESNYVFKLSGAQYLRFHKLTLQSNTTNGASYSTIFSFNGTWDHITIDSSNLSGAPNTFGESQALIYTTSGSTPNSLIINGNTMTNDAFAIVLRGVNNGSLMKGLQITHNAMSGFYAAVYLAYQDGPVITGNTFQGISYYAMEIDYSFNAFVITKNVVTGGGMSYGMGFYSIVGGTGDLGNPARGLIANNTIALTNAGTPFQFTNVVNFDVDYNSFNTSGLSTGSVALYVNGTGTGSNNFLNNVIANTGGGFAIGIANGSTLGTSDYNDLYTTGNFIGYWGATYGTDLAGYRSLSGREANSVAVDPLFTSAIDLHAKSPWIDGKATVVAEVSDDIDGQARSGSTPDIGADEFTPPAGSTTPLSGTYTIGASGTYGTFGAAVGDLLLKGVSGPVTFNVQTGSYNEHIVLTSIPGASGTNTVTFQASSGIANNSALFFLAAAPDSNYVVKLLGAKYVRFHKMKFAGNTTSAATYGTVFNLNGGVDYVTIDSSIIQGSPNSTGTAQSLVITNIGATTHSFVMNANTFSNGSYAIYFVGWNGTYLSKGVQVTSNTFTGFYYGAFLQYLDSPVIDGNTMTNCSYISLELDYSVNGMEIAKNKITSNSGTYGISIYAVTAGNGDLGNPPRGLLANNFVALTTTGIALTMTNVQNFNIYNNSFLVTGASSGSVTVALNGTGAGLNNFVDNVMAHTGGGYPFAVYNGSTLGTSDYNDLYTTGNFAGLWGTTSAANLAAFQSLSGREANSVSTYPFFTSATDLHSKTPWLNGKATVLPEVTDDIDGQPRDGSNPDIGADEFTPPAGSTTPLAGAYTIGAAGNYTTFAAAVGDLLLKGISAPVTFNVLNGTYNEHIVLWEVPGASNANTVTFQANSASASAATLYFFAAAPESNYVVKLLRTKYVRFHRMKFSANNSSGATYGTVFNLNGGFDNVTIDSTIIQGPPNTTGTSQALVVTVTPSNATSFIMNANAFANGGYAIYLSGINGTVLEKGTVINNNTFTGFYYPIYVAYQDGPVIDGNTITNHGYDGIEVDYCTNGIEITRNKIVSNAASYGIGMYSDVAGNGDLGNPPRGLIANNFIAFSSTGTPFSVSNTQNLDFYNNSALVSGASTGSAVFVFNGTGAGLNNVVDNVFANTGGGYVTYITNASSLGISDYNDLYTTGNFIALWGSTPYNDLPAFRTVSGKEANSVPYNPLFLSGTDLHARSPWINGKGVPLATVFDDIDGQARDASNPDIGADEFTPAPGSTTPLAGAYTIGSGGTYTTFGAAVFDLLLKGVSAPVTFNVLNGAYNEHIALTDVPGSSPANTVTFQANSSSAANATLYFSPAAAESNYTVKIVRARNLRFHRMKFTSNTSPSATYAAVFNLNGAWDNIVIDSCILFGSPGTTGTAQSAILGNTAANATSFIVNANTIANGGYGIYLLGINASYLTAGTQITGNAMSGLYDPVFLQYQNSPVVDGNNISSIGYTAIEVDYSVNAIDISKNRLVSNSNGYSIYMYSCTGGTGGLGNPNRALVSNNVITNGLAGSPYGITLNYVTNCDIAFNSVNLYGAGTGSVAMYMNNGSANSVKIVNNIFSTPGGGYALSQNGVPSSDTSDHNDLFTIGAHLAYWGGDRATLADLRSASSKDASSVSVLPGFFSNTNLHTLSSGLDSLGMPFAAVDDDIDGNVRDPLHPDIGAYEFSEVMTFNQTINNYWNLLSLPVTPTDARKSTLYPSAASNAFIYGPLGYQVKDTLPNKLGYWIRFVGDQSSQFNGSQRLRDTFTVVTSWNLVGSISYAIPKSGIVQTPSSIILGNIFAYDPVLGYAVADTIKPGLGYWVRTTGPGTLILDVNATVNPPMTAEKTAETADPSKFNALRFENPNGGASELYFSGMTETARYADQFTLPPVPPAGAFDLRFASNRILTVLGGSSPVESNILLQGNASALRVTWKLNEGSAMRYALVERLDGKIVREVPLAQGGSLTIPAGSKSTYSLKVADLPSAYALMQNYPNPFNPSTRIEFALPASVPVTLHVYNILGQEVATPISNFMMDAGMHAVDVDAHGWVSGVYFYRLTAGSFTAEKKMMLLK